MFTPNGWSRERERGGGKRERQREGGERGEGGEGEAACVPQSSVSLLLPGLTAGSLAPPEGFGRGLVELRLDLGRFNYRGRQ